VADWGRSNGYILLDLVVPKPALGFEPNNIKSIPYDSRMFAAGRAGLEAVKLEIAAGPFRFQPAVIESFIWGIDISTFLDSGLGTD